MSDREVAYCHRCQELRATIAELRDALADTECTCIGPQPSVDEGTKCVRCALLEKNDG